MAEELTDDQQETWQQFKELVNMQPHEIEDWLQTDESKQVGYRDTDSDESVGHKSGRKIVKIKRRNKADLTDDDFAHMRKVCGYIKRHTAQRPNGDVSKTDWCYSLKNWGHDPTQ